MKAQYSLIRYVSNPLSKENFTIGLIVLSDKKVFYKFSERKTNLVSRIDPENFKLFDYTLKEIQSFMQREIRLENAHDAEMNQHYLKRLSIYNNGFIQFDKPIGIDISFDEENFETFFEKFIEIRLKHIEKHSINRSFETTIARVFKEPLKDIIDVNVKIKKEQIPGLFFDYKLDGIGVNGVVYSVKAIDLNSNKPLDSIKRDISEFESLNYRLDCFSEENLFTKNQTEIFDRNKHFLVIDPYEGTKESYRQLYEILSKQSLYELPFKLINTIELGKVTDEIKNSNPKKFLELLKKL